MHGILLTYQTLATTRNAAAVDLLSRAIDSDNSAIASMAVAALVQRPEPKAARALLLRWPKLAKKDIAVVQKASPWIDTAVMERLTTKELGYETEQATAVAIRAATDLNMLSALVPLIALAESNASTFLRKRASESVVRLVQPLRGLAAGDHATATIRNQVLARLTDSVKRLDVHQNESLVQAFLCVTNAGDGDIRKMIAERGPAFDAILGQFATSDQDAILQLLASYVKRRNPDPKLIQTMRDRTDDKFRNALLDAIGKEPGATTLRNIADLGVPKSWPSGQGLIDQLDPTRHAALVHLFVASQDNTPETLAMLVSAIQHRGPGAVAAAARGLAATKVLDIDFWMRAAGPIADNNQDRIAADQNSQLLQGLIDLMDHQDDQVVDGVRHVLSPMHADAMLPRMSKLRGRSRRRIGRVVLMIDTDAVNRVRDALRHPVLKHRLEAIAMADSLALVDLLVDSFTHISSQDHQQARISAAEAMGRASSRETVQLLETMVQLPESSVRDAAESALQRRYQQNQKTRAAGR